MQRMWGTAQYPWETWIFDGCLRLCPQNCQAQKKGKQKDTNVGRLDMNNPGFLERS